MNNLLRKPQKRFRPTMIPDCDLWSDSSFQHAGVKSGNAAQFTAANSEYLSIADNAALSMGDIDFMIAGWVYLDSLPTSGNNMTIVGKWLEATVREYMVIVNNTGGTIRFQGFVRNTADTVSASTTAETFGTPETGTWYFVVFYHNATTNLIGISVNDGAFDTAATTGGVNDGNSAFTLGRFN